MHENTNGRGLLHHNVIELAVFEDLLEGKNLRATKGIRATRVRVAQGLHTSMFREVQEAELSTSNTWGKDVTCTH